MGGSTTRPLVQFPINYPITGLSNYKIQSQKSHCVPNRIARPVRIVIQLAPYVWFTDKTVPAFVTLKMSMNPLRLEAAEPERLADARIQLVLVGEEQSVRLHQVDVETIIWGL